MPNFNSDPDEGILVYTTCCGDETPPQAALLVYTLCPDCECPPGPAIRVYTKVAPPGPGTPLKFELDLP